MPSSSQNSQTKIQLITKSVLIRLGVLLSILITISVWGWSDHWSFWQQGYPAIMVTDTAPYRYLYYHKEEDTTDKIDFDKLTRVVSGLAKVISDLAE